ncbi:MAG TPA: energy transducer TonB [Candidatus Sulfotelmatobacter sp.]|jgi:TonB family protein|nr:energy transducer TonB [Candidatus Sulfotelmatobacter sp.]
MLILAVSLLLACSLAAADESVEDQLRATYLDKTLTLRHFYKGSQLSFQSDGSSIGATEVGPWTVYAEVQVKSINLSPHTLHIHARRVYLVFDGPDIDGKETYRDMLASLHESKLKDRDKLEEFYSNNGVDVDIGFTSENPDLNALSSGMGAVFLMPGESTTSILPSLWQDYSNRQAGQPLRTHYTSETVYQVRPPKVSPPRPTYTPEPEFSEEAREAKFESVAALAIVVTSSGSVEDARVISPVGLGLDEKAVGQVSKWKFDPATMNGKPVAVAVRVEVDFHLN